MDRRRAPAREGVRTTLKVPAGLHAAAQQLATETGTTPNDALVHLAEEGLSARRRRERAARLAEERRAAVAQVGFADAIESPPSPEELQAAMLAGRSGS